MTFYTRQVSGEMFLLLKLKWEDKLKVGTAIPLFGFLV